MKLIKLLLAAFATLALAGEVVAQPSYPALPIKLVVPFPAGGDSDILGRVLAQKLGAGLQQTVVVDNRPGATGMIGVEAVARAKPDGYTLLLTLTATHAMLPHLHARMSYDALKDFMPVGQAVRSFIVLVVDPSLPVKSVPELIALAKSKPGKLSYASWGNGSGGHLVGEAVKSRAGIDLTHVPYKGVAPAMNDLVAGHIPIMFTGLSSALPYIKAGKMRALAVITRQRVPTLPDVPTLIEQGIDFEAEGWYGLFAPAGTRPDIVMRLNAELNKALELPEIRDRLLSINFVPQPTTPEQFSDVLKSDYAKWGKIINTLGIKLD
ncbi:MAG: Bug family tripartite tricarboxylate transporter substrate binding protein [Cupriavidus necator]